MTVNSRSVTAFFLGCLTPIPVQSIGLIYIGEVVLLVVAIWVALTRMNKGSFWSPTATRFILLLLLAFVGYVTSDLVRGTAAVDYVRGWAKIAFIVTDFIAFHYLIRRNSSAIPTFLMGYALSRLAVWFTIYVSIAHGVIQDQWKAGIGIPLTLLVLCLLAATKVHVRVLGFLMIALGVVHVLLDFRSMGGICFVLAAILLATKSTKAGRIVDKRVLSISVAGCALLLAGVYIATQDVRADRRGASNAWRFATSIALIRGIERSPLIGNGSWSSDPQMEGWRDDAMESAGVSRYAAGKSDRFTGHSEILQAWYEGGIATVFFFLYYGYQLASTFLLLLGQRLDKLSGLWFFWLLYISWGYLLNPLNGIVRVEIAFALAIICHLRAEQQRTNVYRRARQFTHTDPRSSCPAQQVIVGDS